jgi:hypothetical protein
MSKAAELAALIGSQTALSNRNLVINGAMQVAQRGTSTSSVTSTGIQTCDRYTFTPNNLGTWSVSQSSTAPSGFANSLKLEATTADASPAAGDYALFLQKIEGQNLQQLKKGTASAESVTLSFWVRSSKIGTYIVELFDNDNSRSISASYTISSANTFEYKTLTFAGDTTGALNNDNNTSLEVIWYLAAGSTYTSGTLQTSWGARTAANQAVGQVNMADTANATWYITGVQFEVGEQATPFEHRSFGDELNRCLRYYISETYAPSMQGSMNEANSRAAFAVPDIGYKKMRAAPTFSLTNLSNGVHRPAVAFYTISSITSASTDYLDLNMSGSLSGGVPLQLMSNRVIADSEL